MESWLEAALVRTSHRHQKQNDSKRKKKRFDNPARSHKQSEREHRNSGGRAPLRDKKHGIGAHQQRCDQQIALAELSNPVLQMNQQEEQARKDSRENTVPSGNEDGSAHQQKHDEQVIEPPAHRSSEYTHCKCIG